VLHPVLQVRHDENGVAEVIGDLAAGKTSVEADRVSLIHVHVPKLSEADAALLSKQLSAVLAQVHAAVADWKPMLARLDEAVSAYGKDSVPLERGALD